MGVSVSKPRQPSKEGISHTKYDSDIQVKPLTVSPSKPVIKQQPNATLEYHSISTDGHSANQTQRQANNNDKHLVSAVVQQRTSLDAVQQANLVPTPHANQSSKCEQNPVINRPSTAGLGQRSRSLSRHISTDSTNYITEHLNSAGEQSTSPVVVKQANTVQSIYSNQGRENEGNPVTSRPSTPGHGRQSRSLTRCMSAQSRRLQSRSVLREQPDLVVKTKTIQVTSGLQDMGAKPQFVKNRSKHEAKRQDKSIFRQKPSLSRSQSNPDSKTESKLVQHESRQVNRRKSFSAVKSIGKWNTENQSDSVAKDQSSYLPAKGLYESVARKQPHPNPKHKLKSGGAKNQPKTIKRSNSTHTVNELEKPSSECWAVRRSQSVPPAFFQSKPNPDVKKVTNQGAKKFGFVPHEQLKDQAVINLPAVVTNEGSEKSTDEKDSVIPSLPPVVNKGDHTTQTLDTNATKISSFNPNKTTNTRICKKKEHKPTTSIPPVILAKPTRPCPGTAGPLSCSRRVSN